MPKVCAFLCLSLFFAGCGVFKTPEPDLLRLATYVTDGVKFGEPFGLAYRKGELFVSDGDAGAIWKIASDGKRTLLAGGLGTPSHITFDDKGYLLVADSGTHTIKRIRAGGDIEIVAGVENTPGFADGNSNEALFRAPIGIAFSDGAIYVADTYNDRIRMIRNGQVSTLAGSSRGFADGAGSDSLFNTPTGIVFDKGERLLVADTGNSMIRAIDPAGNVSTVSGSQNLESPSGWALSEPAGFAVSEKGDIFFTDGNTVKRIRKDDGQIETVTDTERGYSDSAQSEPRRFNRPTGLAIGSNGELFVADSENQAVRVFGRSVGKVLSADDVKTTRMTAAEFKSLAPPRWPYEPGDVPRDVAGTLGEIRGAIDRPEDGLYFHNGLDIAGAYGERAVFVRSEKVLRPLSADNFGTLREYLRLPTMGYVHVRLGRDQNDKPFGDARFIFDESDGASGPALTGVRVPRGARFDAGEVVGTLNAMNHVHLIVGRSASEFNALEALGLPGLSDSIAPVITSAAIQDESGTDLETASVSQGARVTAVVEAYDRMDGNSERRRLGVFKAGFQIVKDRTALTDIQWRMVFDRLPGDEAVPAVYASPSSSGAAGTTIFRYIVTDGMWAGSAEAGLLPLDGLAHGKYILRVWVADFFGNAASKDVSFEVK